MVEPRHRHSHLSRAGSRLRRDRNARRRRNLFPIPPAMFRALDRAGAFPF